MNYKLNINRLLESAKRSDVRGYNIYTCGIKRLNRPSREAPILAKWDEASLGLAGKVAVGHEIDKNDLIIPMISVNNSALEFCVLRNRWTPAYMDTVYRCKPFGEYKKSGLIAIREKKCFTQNDTFISHLTISNDGREPITVHVTLSLPFDRISEGGYSVEAKIIPRSLRKDMTLVGFAVAKTDQGESAELTVPPHSQIQLRYGFAFSHTSVAAADLQLSEALNLSDPFSDSETRFNEWMDLHAPKLKIENIDLLKIYYYRFFVIKSAIHTPSEILPESDFYDQCVYESPFGSWFGAPVGLPIPLQIEEMKWMKDHTALRSHIANWCREVGSTQGYIQFTPMAIWNLYLQTKDSSIIFECYEAVKAYTLKKRTLNEHRLPITVGSWVTGAEYQPSFYQNTEPKWDWRYDREGAQEGFPHARLYRVDECVMYAANLTACKNMASVLGRSEDVAEFSSRSADTIEQIRKICWNDEKKFFFDRDADSGQPCDEAYCYDGFMPRMFSLLGEEYDPIFEKLCAGERFDGSFSLTSVGKDCPMYWFDNCIAGPTASSISEPHAYGCSWNGPIWPFAVSLILEALGNASYSNKELYPIFERIFMEYTDLHFDFGDRSTPCICEHYRPTDGLSFSPYTEYFHSEWINLFFSYYLGIQITESGISFAPITEEEFCVDGVVINGKNYCFSQSKKDGTHFCEV